MKFFKRLRSDYPEFDALLDVIEGTTVQSTQAWGAIVTHSGTFHCDEALACGLLKAVPEFVDMPVCRTRDKALFPQGAVVVDVGGEFDARANRFDHHQNTFKETFYDDDEGLDAKHKIKLSSAGLVFKYHGMTILRQLVPAVTEVTLRALFRKMYNGLIEEIDALDNGVPQCEGKSNYRVSTGITNSVTYLRLGSSETSKLTPEKQEVEEHNRFKEAMELTVTEFCMKLHKLVMEWLPARAVVEEALQNAKHTYGTEEIIVLSTSVPWKSHMQDLEREAGVFGRTKFCLFPEGENWRVQAAPTGDDEFGMRIPLKWKGLNDEKLCEASGIPGCVFVHGSGFMGANKTYKGALDMAIASLGQ